MVFFKKDKGTISGKFPGLSASDKVVLQGDTAAMVAMIEEQKPRRRKSVAQTAGRALSDALPVHILNPYGAGLV